jgi:hypothetical protein
MNPKLLIYFSSQKFQNALAKLHENPKAEKEVEILSSFDFKSCSSFQGAIEKINIVKFATWCGSLIGLTTGFVMAWYPSVIDTPLNVGGRPLNSWPAFIPLVFVLGVLFSALGGFVAFLLRLKFPEPYHPVFDFPDFQLQKDQYYLLASSQIEPSLLMDLAPEKIVEAPR